MLTNKKKQTLMEKNRRHDKDTGSPAVQIALLSERIEQLAKHLKKNPKDQGSRRGLLNLVAKRRGHEKYITANKKK